MVNGHRVQSEIDNFMDMVIRQAWCIRLAEGFICNFRSRDKDVPRERGERGRVNIC